MYDRLLVAFLASLVVLSANASAQTSIPARMLIEWNFDSPSDLDRWPGTRAVSDLAVKDGYLTGRTTGKDPFITSPPFEITTAPLQFVEIRMRTSVSNAGEVYWTNTTDAPYEGFRPDDVKVISYAKGDFRVYRFFPFWQDKGKIIRLRLDPPEGGEFALDYIMIMELSLPTAGQSFYDFAAGAPSWISAGGAQPSITKSGLHVVTSEETLLIAPTAGFDADERPWLTLRIKCTGTDYAVAKWVTDALPGVQSFTFDLRPDGEWHSYNILAEDIAEWQGNISLLGLEIHPRDKASVEIAFAGALETRKGPAELFIRNFSFTRQLNRIGAPWNLRADVTNVGGEPTADLRAILELGRETYLAGGLLDAEVSGLGPGSTLVLYWSVVGLKPGFSPAKLTMKGDSGVLASRETKLRWYPAVKAFPSKYVPKPKPVRGQYEVGVYYFPGWWDFHRWAVLDSFVERHPILGYYREGDPDVMDWHIKWMAEHGITFMIFDWYWSAGARSLEHALHKGYFSARYRDQIKFCLLWANHNPDGSSSAEDMENVTKYWLDNYFLLPEYMKIDGKPVIVIFSPYRLTKDLGIEGTRKALERSREMARERGLPGIYFVACVYPRAEDIKVLEQEGYDALSGYNYPPMGAKGRIRAPYEDNVAGYREAWDTIADNTTLRYIPVTDPGWDSRPWHGPNSRVWTGKTPALFKRMLENAKAFVDKRNPDADPKVVFIESWNEFGEGDFIEPHKEWGFDHVDAVREVFTDAPEEHDDLIPDDVKLGPYSFPRPEPKTAWEFDDPAAAGWSASQHMTEGRIENGSLVSTSTGPDPAIYSQPTEIDSSKLRAVEIRMKVDKGKGAQLFFANRGRGFTEPSSVRFELIPDGEFHVYKLDLSKSPGWRRKIAALRLDPTDIGDAHVEVDYIRFRQ